jgi:hypothetical protein
MLQLLAYKEVSVMEMDDLAPTGYFSEFSWHSFEEDGPPDTTPFAFDLPRLLTGTRNGAEVSDADSSRDLQEAVID